MRADPRIPQDAADQVEVEVEVEITILCRTSQTGGFISPSCSSSIKLLGHRVLANGSVPYYYSVIPGPVNYCLNTVLALIHQFYFIPAIQTIIF